MVHTKGRSTIELTDLGVEQPHRGQGLGGALMASALETGLRMGRSTVSLAAQDNGSGHLVRWYQGIGFTQVGVNRFGYPQLEAPIGRVLSSVR